MDKKRLAADIEAARRAKGLNQDQAAELLRVSRTTVGNWEDPNNQIAPLPKRWDLIKAVLGIDCQQYDQASVVLTQGAKSQGVVIAKDNSTVNAGCDFGAASQFTVTLTEFEYKLFTLFRLYGNQAIADRCLKQLQAMQAMSTI
jgi:DNA-binding XRE family transcriptional regulator